MSILRIYLVARKQGFNFGTDASGIRMSPILTKAVYRNSHIFSSPVFFLFSLLTGSKFCDWLDSTVKMRQLKHHEKKLLKKVDFLQWKKDDDVREIKIIRRYHLQKREDYHKYVQLAITIIWPLSKPFPLSEELDSGSISTQSTDSPPILDTTNWQVTSNNSPIGYPCWTHEIPSEHKRKRRF